MLMKRPHFCSRMRGTAARVTANAPFRWVSRTASHSSSVMLKIIRSRRIPALFTTMSTRPKWSRAVWMMFFPPALGLDLVHALVRRRAGGARPVLLAAVVVHHHLGALLGHEERDLAADPAGRPGHHHHFVLEHHGTCLL